VEGANTPFSMFPRSCEIPSVNGGAPSRPPHQRNKILKKRNFGKSCDFEQATTTSPQYDFTILKIIRIYHKSRNSD
jgi:hypothetical protein